MKRIGIGSVARLTGLVVCLTLQTLASGVTPAEAVTRTPHIQARPNDVMVNTTVGLSGRGFPAHKRLKIAECSMITWVVVAQHPCNGSNAIFVHTNRRGRFVSPFTVTLCSGSRFGSYQITERTCYIGSPEPQGVDTITLVGAARITVTYP